MVMKNADWMRTVENVRKSDGIWDDTPQVVMPKKPCIRDFIGYGKRFNPNIGTTAEIMKELREGEEP